MMHSQLAIGLEKQLIKDIAIAHNPESGLRTLKQTINRLFKEEPLIPFTIQETIHKPLDQYKQKHPHVQAGKLLVKKGETVKPGDYIHYIIIKGDEPLSDRALPSTIVNFDDIDLSYYLNQVMKVTSNIYSANGYKFTNSSTLLDDTTKFNFTNIERNGAKEYQYYLKTIHWLQLRNNAIKQSDNKCQLCSNPNNLEVHHNTYERIWQEKPSDLIVLCENHHELIHKQGGLKWDVEKLLPVYP